MKRISKKVALLCSVGLCALMFFSVNNVSVCACEEVAVASENDSRSTNMTWYYKEINGELYMRLWNHLTQEWVTDWVPAVGYPGN